MNTKVLLCVSLLTVIQLALALPLCAQGDQTFTLKTNDLRGGRAFGLDKLAWKYHAGDDSLWAAKDFDDSDWRQVKSSLLREEDFNSIVWNGRAWFRLRLRVDESLVGQPLALRVWHWGASEIYLDGNLIHSFGKIVSAGDEEYNPRGLFVPVVFGDDGEHTIAVRYSFMSAGDLTQGRGRWLARARYTPGVSLYFTSGNDAAFRLEERARDERDDYALTGLLTALALIHFLLFVFYRQQRGNLFYSLFAFGIAATLLLERIANTSHLDATIVLLADIGRNEVQGLAVMSLLAFLYVEFAGRVSKFFWVLLAIWLVGIVLHATQVLSLASNFTPIMLVVTLVDCLRIMLLSLKQRRTGAWIIAVGVAVLVAGVTINIAEGQNFISLPNWLDPFFMSVTILSVPLMVSIYLGRNFAQTSKNLEEQLVQVKEFSERELEHERTEAELRLKHEQEKAENERRARELEEARGLQLSMLPKSVPKLPNLEIAVYMKPATEVGGDYYDFHISEDGTLTVAVGDATGHGLKAGTMVTATKSLFNNLAHEPEISYIFRQSSAALKRMNLRGMFMAMAMAKIKDNHLTVSCAGMPPALVYRNEIKRVEEISIKAMPLGGPLAAPYEQREIELSAGDCVLLMSDGFPEMFNEEDEMLGFDKAKRLLAVIADEPAQEIINRFVEAGEKWAGTRAQDDDVTFVVLKVGNLN
jgi:serine phosphatase RsbU (regulator of sigma subunit)